LGSVNYKGIESKSNHANFSKAEDAIMSDFNLLPDKKFNRLSKQPTFAPTLSPTVPPSESPTTRRESQTSETAGVVLISAIIFITIILSLVFWRRGRNAFVKYEVQLGHERRTLPCGIQKSPSSGERKSSAHFSPSLSVVKEHPSAGFLPVSEACHVFTEKDSISKPKFLNSFLPRVRGKGKPPSSLLKSKPKSKSYSSIGYSCPKQESDNLISPESNESTSRQIFSRVALPKTSRCSKGHKNHTYLDNSNLFLAIPKSTLRKVKSLPTLSRSISPPEESQDLKTEIKTDLRSYEPLQARGEMVDEKEEH